MVQMLNSAHLSLGALFDAYINLPYFFLSSFSSLATSENVQEVPRKSHQPFFYRKVQRRTGDLPVLRVFGIRFVQVLGFQILGR